LFLPSFFLFSGWFPNFDYGFAAMPPLGDPLPGPSSVGRPPELRFVLRVQPAFFVGSLWLLWSWMLFRGQLPCLHLFCEAFLLQSIFLLAPGLSKVRFDTFDAHPFLRKAGHSETGGFSFVPDGFWPLCCFVF